MRQLELRRKKSSDLGTYGELYVDGKKFCVTGELPWRDNEAKKSCIPAGTYPLKWQKSPKFGWCYEIQQVPDRTRVLIHKGNWCGDTDKGLHSNVEGCTLLGRSEGVVQHPTEGWKQYGISGSGATIDAFHELMNQEDATLTVVDEYLETGEVGDTPVA